MINYLLAFVLIVIYILILIWGLNKKDRIYQYPFLVSGFSVVFLLPQIISLINDPGTVVTDAALSRVLFMSILCIGASWIGYQIPIPANWLLKKPTNLNQKYLSGMSFVYVGLGLFFTILLTVLPDGQKIELTGQGSGLLTIIIFMMRGFLYLGFPIILLKIFKSNKTLFSKIIPLLFAISIPLYHAIFWGRRSSTFLLFLSISISLYFTKKFTIGKPLIVAGIILALILNLNISEYRNVLISGEWGQLQDIEYLENTKDYLQDNKILELRNAAVMMDLTTKTGRYGLGTLYWDQFVFQFIPGQLIGREKKDSLMLKKSIRGHHLPLFYNYRKSGGTTATGIGEAFTQFDYFGCLVFAIAGLICKFWWLRSLTWNNTFEQVVYINILQDAVVKSVTIGHSWFFNGLIIIFVFSLPLILICHYQNSATRPKFYKGLT